LRRARSPRRSTANNPSSRPTKQHAVCRKSQMVVLPVLIVFLMLQRHILRGIATTGLK
jgi:ABC-type glycerol-3-phosphate transport system permease component